MLKVEVFQFPHGSTIELPRYETDLAAGADLRAAISETLVLKPQGSMIIPTGIAIALPKGYEAQIRPRSGLAAKNLVTVLNSPGTIDADYRGEIKVILINHGSESFEISPAMRIAQIVIAPVIQVQWDLVSNLSLTKRGIDGFGSTGQS